MTPLLDLPAVRQQVRLLSIEDYHRMGELGVFAEDVELLRGIVVKKMPKSPLHEFVAEKLLDILLANAPQAFRVRVERPLRLRQSEPEPDISVVLGKPEDWIHAHPSTAHLVVEVAITSESVDRGKADIYADAGIPEYWVVLPEARAVDAYHDPSPEGYLSKTRVSEGEILRCTSIAEVQFGVGDILPKA